MKATRYHYTLVRMPIIQTSAISNADEGVEQQELSLIAGGNTEWYSHFGKQFLKNQTCSYHMINNCALLYLPKEIETLHLHKNQHTKV